MIFVDEADKVLVNHPIIHIIEQHIIHNMPEYLIGASALIVATIVTMPILIPKSLQDWWTWMRNALQTAVPAARHNQPPADPPSPTIVDPREEPPK